MRLVKYLFWLLYEVLQCLIVTNQTEPCSKPLGLMSGAIQDWQLSASSSYPQDRDPECHVRFARLYQPRSRAWCSKASALNEWILVDLGVAAQVTGVMTQGRGEVEEWVTLFSLAYSEDAYRWQPVTDLYGNTKVFAGNSDSHSVKLVYLDQPITARFLRLHVLDWANHPSLRLEVLGCQECNKVITEPPFAKLTASSHQSWMRSNSCEPEDAHVANHKAWCARYTNEHQWLQFDLGPALRVTGVFTKGRADSRRRHWVTSYSMSYSNDSLIWYFYKDDNQLGPKVFGGNMDKGTERRHYLNRPFNSRYVRLHPATWHQAIALRAGLLGCPHHGACGPGFLQVNSLSHCVANLAYGRPTWVNDKRHGWKDWEHGNSDLAVDGDTSMVLPRCAIIDNYYVDQPLWMVDLGWRERVSGVIMTQWQGAGQDKMTSYRDYVYNLDRLTVYVSNRGRLELFQLATNSTKCATITRANGAVFKPRLHFECPDQQHARFVYVTAKGVSIRWKKLYTAVLCEVQVYS